MGKLRMSFVEAIEAGEFGVAKDILLEMGDKYIARGGFDTVEEKVNFERVVKWFDEEFYQAGLVQ